MSIWPLLGADHREKSVAVRVQLSNSKQPRKRSEQRLMDWFGSRRKEGGNGDSSKAGWRMRAAWHIL